MVVNKERKRVLLSNTEIYLQTDVVDWGKLFTSQDLELLYLPAHTVRQHDPA